jgi:hypothetical protein
LPKELIELTESMAVEEPTSIGSLAAFVRSFVPKIGQCSSEKNFVQVNVK